MTQKQMEDFWENACDVFGFDVSSKTHPMNKAFLSYLEMMKEMEEEEEEEDKMTCKCGFEGNCDEFEYLPSIEDEKAQQILGEDFCIACYKKYECFKFVEHIKN